MRAKRIKAHISALRVEKIDVTRVLPVKSSQAEVSELIRKAAVTHSSHLCPHNLSSLICNTRLRAMTKRRIRMNCIVFRILVSRTMRNACVGELGLSSTDQHEYFFCVTVCIAARHDKLRTCISFRSCKKNMETSLYHALITWPLTSISPREGFLKGRIVM